MLEISRSKFTDIVNQFQLWEPFSGINIPGDT